MWRESNEELKENSEFGIQNSGFKKNQKPHVIASRSRSNPYENF